MEFRIAVESCIGLSEFSDVVYAEVASEDKAFANCPKVDKTFCLQPPSGLKVTSFHYDTAWIIALNTGRKEKIVHRLNKRKPSATA